MAEQDSNVIVAIPSTEDYVWRISSEKIPHMTLLYLEDLSTDPDLESIVEFLQHASTTVLPRFSMSVDHRGTLGDDDADVLFFGGYGVDRIAQFRQTLLAYNRIQVAYNAVQQYPTWTPHLTLGYPTSPAHPDDRDYPGINYVRFEKIALWTGDFTGPAFELNDLDLEVSMTETLDEVLAHHGIKGMHWGVRRSKAEIAAAPSSEDHTRTTELKAKAKAAGGTHVLTNKEMQDAINRMNLEQQYSRLSGDASTSRGKAFVDGLKKDSSDVLRQTAKEMAKQALSKKVAAALAKQAVKTAAGA